ncbi:alpha-E domain-containing protein [Fulvivirga lutimaris]|uniref:alpha-E domain-containing protein n=1 Tax=Fulvivirga lutimaris TaxID=1819566 RepID=UPI0012BD6718|nr:alpha-E domain-containing protein [Fulvivirga lutimaris]MTI38926.1 alpha-E domain-containing protein [Fulvivirga lutimaris]
MLSRVANSLFWLGRYAERAENYARFIDVNFNLSLDLPPGMTEQWDPLISATGGRELFVSLFDEKFTRENSILFLAFDARNPDAIINTVKYARENARIVRESIPRETWEVLNDLYYFVLEASNKKIWKKEDPKDCFKLIRNKLQLLSGIAYDNIPRSQGWYFTKLGQYLERADKTSRILDVKYHFLLPSVDDVGSPLDFLHWVALLKSVTGFNAYRRVHGKINPTKIAEYLVLDRFFPRSILFCLMSAEHCLHEISESKHGYSNAAEKAIGNLRADLEFADVNDVFDLGLHEYLDNLQLRLNAISDNIHDQYFQIRSNFTPDLQTQE